MDRARLELVLREAGVGADMSSALASELMDASVDDGNATDDRRVRAYRRRRTAAWHMDRSELENDWRCSVAVVDADIEDELGDFCGWRVA